MAEKKEEEKSKQEKKEIKEETVETAKEEVEKVEGDDFAEVPKEEQKEEKEKTWEEKRKEEEKNRIAGWGPKTKLGRDVKDGKIKSLGEILDQKKKILESEIVDSLISGETELVNIGQSKGKFGGGKRRIWRQTQRKTKEGNVPKFSTLAIFGNSEGYVGIGEGKSKETLPAREKAIRKAKLNIIEVKRGCSGFDCDCSESHTIPLKVTGKSGSVKVELVPAAQGTGLVVANELKKLLKLAGIKDVYSKTYGKKRTTFNLIKAGFHALKKTNIK